MTDYIKREDAINAVADRLCFDAQPRTAGTCTRLDFIDDAKAWIDECQSADVAPVVRCKDCKCWTEWSNGTGSCSRFALDWIGTDANDFCSMGERRDDDIR